MATVTVEITEQLIKEHGQQIWSRFDCPGAYAILALGLPIREVDLAGVRFQSTPQWPGGYWAPVPPEFETWQVQGIAGFDLEPITFQLEVPDELVA